VWLDIILLLLRHTYTAGTTGILSQCPECLRLQLMNLNYALYKFYHLLTYIAYSCAELAISSFQVNAVRALAQILRRYTSLNHLAQAARAVLQNSNQITQMLADINKVDFTSVQV